MNATDQTGIQAMNLIMRIWNFFDSRFRARLSRRSFFGGPVVVSRVPALIGIETVQARKCLQCIRAEVFLINDAIGTDDKRLYTRDPILGRRRGKGESADHYAFHDKVHLSKRGSLT